MSKKEHNKPEEMDRKQLEDLVAQLAEQYQETIGYMKGQIQALIDNDLKELEEKVKLQVQKYEEIRSLEEKFKSGLDKVCEAENINKQDHSLSGLLKKGGSKHLRHVRDKLIQQIKETQRLEKQLIELLEFAKSHNHESIKVLNRLKNQLSTQYDKEGAKKESPLKSISINKRI